MSERGDRPDPGCPIDTLTLVALGLAVLALGMWLGVALGSYLYGGW